jgi:esterase/lipase superfamily enzyme
MGALLLAACATPNDFDAGGTIRSLNKSADGKATPKLVYYATTRCTDNPVGAPDTLQELFGKRCWEAALGKEEVVRLGFGMTEGDKISCGSATVAVEPKDADEKAATAVGALSPLDCSQNFAAIRQAVAATPCRCALVFVHGYNTTFAFGLKRTAQLALDLGYEGLPVMFSFGASGRFNDYVNDIEAATLAAPALRALFQDLSRDDGAGAGAPNIDVVAQSMGSGLSLRAATDGGATLRYVVLAAPDIDPAMFVRFAAKLTGAKPTKARRVTVYTAEYDTALSASSALHGGMARLGSGFNPAYGHALAETDIIDATKRATDPYAHSYFAESELVLNDMREALKGTKAVDRTGTLACAERKPSIVSCEIPCPAGASCGPTLYQRFVRWLLD